MYAKNVYCTDIKIGGILDIIKRNVSLNDHYQKYPKNIQVHELNFFDDRWSNELESAIKDVDICLAADGKYSNQFHKICY